MSMKSKVAFEFSACALWRNSGGKAFLWTFTFPDVLPDPEAFRRWKMLVRAWRIAVGREKLIGLRVVEVHPGTETTPSHGLHFHFVTPAFFPVRQVRSIARSCGFGRIHVRPVDNEAGVLYLAKYLGKKQDALARGCHRWAGIGDWKGRSRVRDIIVEGEPAERARLTRRLCVRWEIGEDGEERQRLDYARWLKMRIAADWSGVTVEELQRLVEAHESLPSEAFAARLKAAAAFSRIDPEDMLAAA
jgi:hypothetical protein